jgi:hypothetical protein
MPRIISISYPEEATEKDEVGEAKTKLFAAKQWVKGDIDLSPVESDIKNLIAMFEAIEEKSKKYSIDEAKLTVGYVKDQEGKLHASISASILNFFKGSAESEVGSSLSENKLFEIIIKRNEES